jgi:phospholipase C
VLQFLEKLISHKTGKKIEEANISTWRRTVCGDLTSIFKPYQGGKIALPTFLPKDDFIEGVHKAQFKGNPTGFHAFSAQEISEANSQPLTSPLLPKQEPGTRPSCALPYQLAVDGALSADKKSFSIRFEASKELFGAKAAGSPFIVYAGGNTLPRSYAVSAGDTLTDSWHFGDQYHLRVHGPNGFYRAFDGNSDSPNLEVTCIYPRNAQKKLTGNIAFRIVNKGKQPCTIELIDNAYKAKPQTHTIGGGTKLEVGVDLAKSFCWYDVSVKVKGAGQFENRYAGRVETGKEGVSDPLMGGKV